MSAKINNEIEEHCRNNVIWQNLPVHLKQILNNKPQDYDRYVFTYSLKNQLRYKGNLVRKIFKNEQRYYELLVEKSIHCLCIFPYHLADIVTKGLRVTPFNYYIDVISFLLKHDKSYDTLPNFTAADCLRVLGIGRNEYLSLVSDLKTNSSKLFRKPNLKNFLPKFPVRINIETWWKVEVGYVLESDIKFVTEQEQCLIDNLIDLGSHTAGQIDYNIVHSLYKKGLVYLDVPISGEDKIAIPPLKNFVMNRVSGDYFENLLYKVFVSADEYMTISELSQMLQVNLDSVKHAISLFCRLGFARRKTNIEISGKHSSWDSKDTSDDERPQITPLNYHSLLINEANTGFINDIHSPCSDELSGACGGSGSISIPNTPTTKTMNTTNNQLNPLIIDEEKFINLNISNECISSCISSSDGNSDFSFINNSNLTDKELLKDHQSHKSTSDELSSGIDDAPVTQTITVDQKRSIKNLNTIEKSGKRIGFLFDSTLTAFLMMGNLSPGLKNHAVTLFEVGKLCDESMNTFLTELEKVSLLDAEGEGEVSRYFAHAVILRSTICALRNLLDGGLDLLRLECLESLDVKTRDRLLEKKYKYLISAAPLTGILTKQFTIPLFGQFFKSSENTHIWSKMFYYHISGYGPPSLLLTKGTILKQLPRIFLGYGKILITILHTDSYVINSENYLSINEQLKNGCVLLQGYGIKINGEIKYETFPFDKGDSTKTKWFKHKGVEKLSEILNLENTCGFITFVNNGVPDIGCDNYDVNVHLERPKSRKQRKISSANNNNNNEQQQQQQQLKPENLPKLPLNNINNKNIIDLQSPMDGSEITNFNRQLNNDHLKSPDENYFANSPQNVSPSNVYRSDDCNEILANELAKLDECEKNTEDNESGGNINSSEYDNIHQNQLVSQSSIEIEIVQTTKSTNLNDDNVFAESLKEAEDFGEMWTILDVNFGVPLFDVDCNTSICERLVKNLCTEENLQKLLSINEDMNTKFMKFISQCLYFEDENIGLVKAGKLIPQPRINLAFDNGKVCYWNVK